jgi:hypothetical protein
MYNAEMKEVKGEKTTCVSYINYFDTLFDFNQDTSDCLRHTMKGLQG